MAELSQYVLTGLGTGASYALVGLGIALIVQVTGVINFAQGDFVMLGGLSFALLVGTGMNPVLAATLAVAGTMATGAIVNFAVIAPARHADPTRLIILTIGASIVIQGAALVAVGTRPQFTPEFSGDEPLRFAGVNLPLQYLWIAGAAGMMVTAVWLLMTRTMVGRAMRAVAMDPTAARLVGISPKKMSLAVFALAALLGGIGGVMLAPIQAPDPQIGIALGLKGFTAAVIGGLDNPAGAVAGGLLIGVLEALAAGYLPSGYKEAFVYGLLVAVLLCRPTGLLRAKVVARV
ncbi:MAG: branched-chain amino acid ABC transporter permease [Micromonosporaceae bacterium]